MSVSSMNEILALLSISALAAYMLVEKFYWRTIGRRVVPLGPPWILGDPNPES